MKKALPVLVAIPMLALMLAACSTPAPETNLDGTTVVKLTAVSISLLQTPELTSTPTWTAKDKLAGWALEEDEATVIDPTEEKALAELRETQPQPFTSDECSASATIEYLPAYNLDRGDLFLTKDSAYSFADANGAVFSNPNTINIVNLSATDKKGTVEFFTGEITSPVDSSSTWVAFRAFDAEVKNNSPISESPIALTQEQLDAGMTVNETNQGTKTTGVPIASIKISCVSASALKAVDKQAVVSAFSLNLQ
jgi:hypothetical protein